MTDREVLEKLAEEWFSHRLLHPAKLDLDGLLKPFKKPDQTPFQKWHDGCPDHLRLDTELKYIWNAALNAVWGSVYEMESVDRAAVRDAIDNNWENG